MRSHHLPTAARPDTHQHPRRLSPRGLWLGFKRLTQLGWPKSFPILQFPNAPLIIAFLAGFAAARAHDPGHAYLAAVSFLAFGIWAYEELVEPSGSDAAHAARARGWGS